jgi:hypothetical protein
MNPNTLPWFTLCMQCVTGVTTSVVAVLVWVISRRQAKTASEKLRLDLYDRRFRIYSRTLVYRDSVLALDLAKPGDQEEHPLVATAFIQIQHPPLGGGLWSEPESYEQTRQAFLEACEEAQFLFPAESEIYAHLVKLRDAGREMETRAMLIEHARQTHAPAEKQNKAIERRNEQFDLIHSMVPPLAALMAPYMRF